MNTVTVRKHELREILLKNKADHREIFLKAQESYRQLVIKELDAMLEVARNGTAPQLRRLTGIVFPQDHTADYERVLGMLDMEVADTVTLHDSEYRNYVQDDWEWSRAWAMSNSRYTSSPKFDAHLNS